MGNYQAFVNRKSFKRHPTLVDDKRGIISNKIELQKTFKPCWPSSENFFKHLRGLNFSLHFLKIGRLNIAYQLGLLDFGRYSFCFHLFFKKKLSFSFLSFFIFDPFFLFVFIILFFNSNLKLLSFYPNFLSSLILHHTTYKLCLKYLKTIVLCHTIYMMKVYYVP
jgi:hypothetical protein